MSLGDDILMALPELRAQALSTMVDIGRFTRPGAPTFDPITGEIGLGTGTVVYEGPLRLRAPSAVELTQLFGEEQVTTVRFIAAVRHNVTGIEIGDVLTIIETSDPLAASRVYRVLVVPSGTDMVLRNIAVEVVE